MCNCVAFELFITMSFIMQIVVVDFSGFVELPGLTTEDHVTLTIIEHYLDLKVSKTEFRH